MSHRNRFRQRIVKPQVEVLEDRCLLATQFMGSFQLGLDDSVFWEGPRVSEPMLVPDIPKLAPTGACETLGEEHTCWDWKLDIAELGRIRVALDWYSLQVRPWSDPRPVMMPGTGFAWELRDPHGEFKTWSTNCFVIGCGYSGELFADIEETGIWTVRVIPVMAGDAVPLTAGDMGFRMRAKLEAEKPLPDEPTVLYPNLRAIPAFEFTFATPVATYNPAVDIPAGPTGCMADELVNPDTGGSPIGRACLRFSMGIENTGDGPLTVVGETDIANPGHFPAYQRLFVVCNNDACPTWQDGAPGSAGELHFHTTHGHFHYEGVYAHRLFAVDDLKKGTLVQVGTGHKSGFSPGNERLADWKRFDQCPQNSGPEQPCNYPPPALDSGASAVLGTGWGDVYEYNRAGNYVDFPISLSDLNPVGGYYVVQGVVDEDDHLLEKRENDNVSYALIYVTGREVYVCERGYGESPWDPHRKLDRPMPTNEPPAGSNICDIGHRHGQSSQAVRRESSDAVNMLSISELDRLAEPTPTPEEDFAKMALSPDLEVASADAYFAATTADTSPSLAISQDDAATDPLISLDDLLLPDLLAV